MSKARHIGDVLASERAAIEAENRQELARILESTSNDEAEVKKRLRFRLESYGLDVYAECPSPCRRSFIDFIVRDRDFMAGIEVKLADTKRGKDVAEWLAQAHRYASKSFHLVDDRGAILEGPYEVPVFVFPQLSGLYMIEGELMNQHAVLERGSMGAQNNVTTMIGVLFGIGEVQVYRRTDRQKAFAPGRDYGLQFAMKGKVLWHTDRAFDEYYEAKYRGDGAPSTAVPDDVPPDRMGRADNAGRDGVREDRPR